MIPDSQEYSLTTGRSVHVGLLLFSCQRGSVYLFPPSVLLSISPRPSSASFASVHSSEKSPEPLCHFKGYFAVFMVSGELCNSAIHG